MLIYGDIREQEKSVMDIELKYIEKKSVTRSLSIRRIHLFFLLQ